MKTQPTVHHLATRSYFGHSRAWFLAVVMATGAASPRMRADDTRVIVEEETRAGLLQLSLAPEPAGASVIQFEDQETRFVRLLIHRSSGGPACLDELEIFGPTNEHNLALASNGAIATASSAMDHPLHKDGASERRPLRQRAQLDPAIRRPGVGPDRAATPDADFPGADLA
jgi:hypothetical protein